MQIAEEYEKLAEIIETGEIEAGVTEARRLVEAGHSPSNIVQKAIVPCLRDIGERFGRLELFLPDMIIAADVVKEIQKSVLNEYIQGEGAIGRRGKVVIGTVYGDIHDIGKNIVASVLEANGFEVHNLGVNVESKFFLQQARALDADIIALSSLMSTSMPYQADVIKLVKDSDADRDRFKVVVGGGPVTPEAAQKMDADGQASDAPSAVKLIMDLLDLDE